MNDLDENEEKNFNFYDEMLYEINKKKEVKLLQNKFLIVRDEVNLSLK
jgi:hypothetical protein